MKYAVRRFLDWHDYVPCANLMEPSPLEAP